MQVDGDVPQTSLEGVSAEGIQSVEQSLLQAFEAAEIGGEGLACRFVGEAEAKASDDGRQRGAPCGDEKEQIEQSGDRNRSSVAFAGEYGLQGGVGGRADKGWSDGRIRLAQGNVSYLSY